MAGNLCGNNPQWGRWEDRGSGPPDNSYNLAAQERPFRRVLPVSSRDPPGRGSRPRTHCSRRKPRGGRMRSRKMKKFVRNHWSSGTILRWMSPRCLGNCRRRKRRRSRRRKNCRYRRTEPSQEALLHSGNTLSHRTDGQSILVVRWEYLRIQPVFVQCISCMY